MIDKELKQLVVDEATKLKQHATADELAGLDYKTLDPDRTYLCIYGQMTGGCYSERATQLLTLCAMPYTGRLLSRSTPNEKFVSYAWRSYSPIEFYIYREGAKNKTLINFLKGKRKTLKVSDL